MKYRNINLFSIDYAYLPRLRGRLTLRRLTLRRNPWTFGVRVFSRIIATHVSIRTSDTSSRLSNLPSQAYRTLLYRSYYYVSVASVHGLSPVESSAQADSTSELLRFL